MSTTLLVLSAIGSAAAAGMDMSAEFAKFKTCGACTKAGYGWCTIKRKCGGFANKQCGVGEQYMAIDFVAPTKKKSNPSPPPTSDYFKTSPPTPPKRERPPPGTDMRAMFAKLRDCASCVGAGYGWCPMQRKCGGFANQQCGLGPNYVAADPPPKAFTSTTSDSQPKKRNGLWESKSKTVVDAPPAAEVPAASPPPAASLLYAGPASPPSPEVQHVEVGADGRAEGTIFASAAVAASNATAASTPLDSAALMALDQQALVDKVLELQATVAALQQAS